MLVDLVNLQIWFLKLNLLFLGWNGRMVRVVEKMHEMHPTTRLRNSSVRALPRTEKFVSRWSGNEKSYQGFAFVKACFQSVLQPERPSWIAWRLHFSCLASRLQHSARRVPDPTAVQKLQKLEERTNFLKEVKLIVAKKCNWCRAPNDLF